MITRGINIMNFTNLIIILKVIPIKKPIVLILTGGKGITCAYLY